MELEQIAVPIIAAYGAILSTVIYYQKWRENKPKIVVDYYGDDPLEPDLLIALRVRNYGKKSITLSYAYIEEIPRMSVKQKLLNILHRRNDDRESTESRRDIEGIEITPGKNCKILFSYYDVPSSWIDKKTNLKGIVVDQLGNVYRTKTIRFY